MELSETLEKVRDGFLDKSAELELLQQKATEQVRKVSGTLEELLTNVYYILFMVQAKSLEAILQQNITKDREIASLKAELAKVSQNSPLESKPKRGLLANIKEAVTSPRKGATARTLRKTVRTPHR